MKKRKHHLAGVTDPLLTDLRDKNFAIVGSVLNKTARRLNEEYEKRHLAQTAGELRVFVGQLGGLQNEHAALRLRTAQFEGNPARETRTDGCPRLDTGLTERIMVVTATDEFNNALEIQQSAALSL